MQHHIIESIDTYVANPDKASWYNWQLAEHHGSKGIERALYLKYYLIIAQTHTFDFFWEMLDKFRARKVTGEFLRKIDIVNSKGLKKEIDAKGDLQSIGLDYSGNLGVQVFYNGQAELLNGGNTKPSSLRKYIDTVCISFRYVSQQQRRERSVSLSRYDFLFEHKEHLDDSFDENDIKIFEKNLKLKSTINQSAHIIRKYVSKIDGKTLYFSKDLNQTNRSVELSNYAVEIMYASLWQWFLGKRVSSSLLRINLKGNVVGICSKGLPYFIEFAGITLEQALWHKGLVSIIFYAYLLMEDDLHTKNIGLTVQYDSDQSRGIAVFGKIDHDYLATNWSNGGLTFIKQFPLRKIRLLIQATGPRAFQDLFSSFRFSPGTGNNFFLQLAHSLRFKPSTTRSHNEASTFLTGLVQSHYQNELVETVKHFKEKRKKISAMDRHITNILRKIESHGLPIKKANEIYKVLYSRIRDAVPLL
ncbi:MAG: hypothetical protein GY750_05215 [Lentisphaerae bacterium]|nr:hypothetical protein [Lentisphaerota bacterium]MCP4100813.1 hypothetical protein [Lentisphaerota bacterium]